MAIGSTLVNLIYEHELSQKQLAIDLHIPLSTLSGYIHDRREPDFDTLIMIADYFNVSCDYLLGHNCNMETVIELPSLSIQEVRLIRYCRELNKEQFEFIFTQLKIMHSSNKKKNLLTNSNNSKKSSRHEPIIKNYN